jgi:hypothetical protein
VLASIAALDNCRFDRRLCGIPAPLLVCRMMDPWDVCLCFLRVLITYSKLIRMAVRVAAKNWGNLSWRS